MQGKSSAILTRSAAIRLGGLLLGGYISLLIGLVYLGQIHLRQALFDQARLTIEKQAAAVNYFFNEQKDEIREFARNPVFNNFFANRAMGMSMEYGLQESLFMVRHELDRLLDRKKLLEHPIYTAISFIDKDATVLVAASRKGEAAINSLPPGISIPDNEAPDIQVELVKNENDSYTAYYCAPITYNNQVSGLILAAIDLQQVILPLLQHSQDTQTGSALMLLGPHGERLVSTSPDRWPDMAGEPEQTIITIPLADDGYILKGMVVQNQKILLTSPWFLGAIALLSLPVMGGLLLLLRLNTRHVLLQAKFEASKQQEEELRYFRQLLDLSTDLIAVIDPETGRYTDVNQAMCDFFRLDRATMLRKRILDHSRHYQTMEQWRKFCGKIRERGRISDEHTGKLPDGTPYSFEMNAHYARQENKEAIVAIFRDISERKQSEQMIRQANQRVNAVLAGIDAVVYVTDIQTRAILYANSKARELYGNLEGKTCWQAIYINQHEPCSSCPAEKLIGENGETGLRATEFQHPDSGRWFHATDCVIPWDDGRLVHLRVATDITTRIENEEALKEAHRQLKELAYYDPLTRLANRRLFIDRVKQALRMAQRQQSGLAICYLDLDEFKQINDQHGHEAGDELLIQVSERLLNNLRPEDTVARWGGDEFALLISDQKDDQQCAMTLARLISTLEMPYQIGSNSFRVTTSIGVTLYPLDDGDPETLLRHADQAMYMAKQKGRNCYHFFDPELDRQMSRRQEELTRIEQALARDEFVLFYQPKIDMAGGKVIGAEALVRWQHPDKGLLSPFHFLPLIEGTRLQTALDWWVLEKAISQVATWLGQGKKIKVSINLSAKILQEQGFIDQLFGLLSLHGVNGQCIELEILESGIIEELDTISAVIHTCQQAGISFALDDYGTGFSTLTHIRRLPVQTLKIDRSFVKEMLTNSDDLHIVEGVIGLAKAFELQVIAEGVENTEIGIRLLELGCRYAQGFGIAKAMPPDVFLPWIDDYQAPEQWLRHGNKQENSDQPKTGG